MTIRILAKYGPISSSLVSWLYMKPATPTWATWELLAVWGLKKIVLDTIFDTIFDHCMAIVVALYALLYVLDLG